MPGLVNAHIHTWEYQLRGIGSDWVGIRDYHGNMHKNLATRYQARDVYLGNLLGALNQIRNGTTTIMQASGVNPETYEQPQWRTAIR